jgi:ribosomal protein L16 Arg81 hydroxylase
VTSQSPLQSLFGAYPAELFFAKHYGREPLHLQSPDKSARFGSLINWSELNQLLQLNSHWDDSRLRLVAGGRKIPAEHYCQAHGAEEVDRRVWRPVPERVTAFVNSGATLILNGVDGLVSAIGELAQALEQALAVRVQSNLYLSKPGNQGLALHFDPHDVLALQIAGSKRWRLYEKRLAPALPGVVTESDLRAIAGPVSSEFSLNAGDLLYIPAGLIHEAQADREVSLHLTLGLKQVCQMDLASLLMQQLAKTPEATMPLYDVHEGQAAIARQVAKLVGAFVSVASSPTTTQQLESAIAANRRTRGRYPISSSTEQTYRRSRGA